MCTYEDALGCALPIDEQSSCLRPEPLVHDRQTVTPCAGCP